ncbi:hypothetical protein A2U01_0088077, partial [Trifolium medium]|nr:hypothetical protein [Trifolium medium]
RGTYQGGGMGTGAPAGGAAYGGVPAGGTPQLAGGAGTPVMYQPYG